MAEIKNVTIETAFMTIPTTIKYDPILKLKIPLPGGEAKYEIPITSEMKDSLEFAQKLSEKIDA